MNMPFSQYQLAHVRKAVFAGFGFVGTAIATALANGVPLADLEHWPGTAGLLAAFIVGFGGTFQIPNKDFAMVEKVIETINPALGDKVAVVLDPVLAANEPTDKPAPEQITPAPLVQPASTSNNAGGTTVVTSVSATVPIAPVNTPSPITPPGPGE